MLKIWKAAIVGLVLLWSGFWVLATPSGPGNINADKVILFEQRALYPEWRFCDIDKESRASYTNLRKTLESAGYRIARTTDQFGLALTVEYLNEYDAFVIPPQMSYYYYQNNDELSAIIEYVESGGNLFLLGEWSTGTNVRVVARELGVEFSEWYYLIEDSEQNTGNMRCGEWDNDSFCPYIMGIPSHPITTGVETIYLSMSSYIEEPGLATPLIIADSPTCWAENHCGTGSCGRGDKKERPFTVLAYMEYGKGQVVFLADASVFCDSIVNRGDNLQLGLNIIDWLTKGDGPGPVDTAKAPSELQVTPISSTQVDLSWIGNSDNDDDQFEIERKTEGKAYTKVASTAANVTTYSDTELEPETGYCYRVRACNSFDCSSYSNEACATTSSGEEPLPVWGCETKRTIGGYMKICTDSTLYQGEIEVANIEQIIDLNAPWPLNTFFCGLVATIGSLLQQFTDWVLPGSDVTKGFVATFSRRGDGYTKLSGTLFGLEFYSDMKIDGSGRTGVQICPKSQLCFWVWQNY